MAVLLMLAHVTCIVDRYLVSIVTEPLKHGLGLSDTQLGLLQGPSFAILFAVASLPMGWVADHVNRRNLIVFGIICWSAATVACGLSRSFPELFVARIFVGIGEAALVPAAMSMIGGTFAPDRLTRAVSIFTSGAQFGRAAAFLGGGALLAVFVRSGGVSFPVFGERPPWQALFIAFGLMGLAVAALISTVVEPARATVDHAPRRKFKGALDYFWRNRGAFIPLFVAVGMLAVVVQVLGAWTVSLFVRRYALSPGDASILVGIGSLVAGPTGSVSGGWLTDRLHMSGRRGAYLLVIGCCLGASPVLAALLWLSPTPVMATISYSIFYFIASMGTAPGYAGVQAVTPNSYRGVLASLFMCVQTLIGTGGGPLLVGVLSDHVFGNTMLGASIVFSILIAAIVGTPIALAARKTFEKSRAALLEA
jgi:MFS family permease